MSLFLRLLRISLWQYCRNNVVKSVWFGKKKINREGGSNLLHTMVFVKITMLYLNTSYFKFKHYFKKQLSRFFCNVNEWRLTRPGLKIFCKFQSYCVVSASMQTFWSFFSNATKRLQHIRVSLCLLSCVSAKVFNVIFLSGLTFPWMWFVGFPQT